MRFILLSALCLAAACDDTVLLENVCGEPCAVTLDGELLLGEKAEAYADEVYDCGLGTIVCEDGIETCDGWRMEHTNFCDEPLLDECDGFPMNYRISEYDYRNDCNNDAVGVCRQTEKVCREDGWECELPDTYSDFEICDGLDNNCNGSTDENAVLFAAPFQYTGPLETANVGECRVGTVQCVRGVESYPDMVTPTEEVCGTDKDEDCDGVIDESDGTVDAAFYISIDYSGSMNEEIMVLTQAICGWVEDPRYVESRFAIDAVAVRGPVSDYRQQITDFATAEVACEALLNFSEPSLVDEYMVYSMVQAMSEEYHWPEGLDRHVIMFTDEPNYTHPAANDMALVEICLSNPDITYGAFLIPSDSWNIVLDGCDFWVDEYEANVDEMLTKLLNRFRGTC